MELKLFFNMVTRIAGNGCCKSANSYLVAKPPFNADTGPAIFNSYNLTQ